ncbi:MAG: Holliday junction resolvase RuvX [Chitinophagaceae bacterium]|nr:Holliday junction resolvase RuvX [Chitinophagaceae bacterium]
MARIIGIDYGTKRVGLSVTDPEQIIATFLDSVLQSQTMEYLKNYVKREKCDGFVIGMPKNLQNKDTHCTQEVITFIKNLKQEFSNAYTYYEIDERFTSQIAEAAILMSGKNKKYRNTKENTDKVSAVIILQSFLEYKKNGTTNSFIR